MSRDILFRGKRLSDGKWVEGFLFEYAEAGTCIGLEPLSANDYSEIYSVCYDVVDPATVGQYTGLADKRGRKIFEGDRCEDSICGTGVIKFSDGMYSIIYDKPTDPEWYASALFIADGDIEVISNIHDPEANPCQEDT